MNERKILLFVISVTCYCLYSVHMWFTTTIVKEENSLNSNANAEKKPEVKPNNSQPNIVKSKLIPLHLEDACTVLEVFTQKPQKVKVKRSKYKNVDDETNTITVIGITAFLCVLVLNALFDVLKVKEAERARRKLNPDGERRQSLAEFANKKTLRRESSKFSLHLSQIAESIVGPNEQKKSPRDNKPYTRAESINSYLGEKTQTKSSAPASFGDTPAEQKLTKGGSEAKLVGARPAPMVRRSSYPALPLNPEIHALMTNSRQSSFESDDETDKKPRRVRILRRF